MNLPGPVMAMMEIALNRLLAMDEEVRDELLAMNGKVIKLHITGFELECCVIPSSDGVQLLADESLEADVVIRGAPFALLKTAVTGDRSSVQEGDIRFEGDVYTGERFQKILQKLDLDWEEPLSQITGDVVANQVGTAVRSGHQWLKGAIDHLLRDTSEYLQEESRDVPAPAEVEIFFQTVDGLRDDAARIAARIRKLERRREENTQ